MEISNALSIAGPTQLPDGQVGVAYPEEPLLERAGGTAPFTWTSTEMPAGLVLDPANGVLSGTPTIAGSFPVTVTVTDAMSATASIEYTVVVPALSITNETLPDGKLDVAYPATTVVAGGGQAPGTWSASGLPTGPTIETTTGVITGTPSATGASTVVIAITDAAGATAHPVVLGDGLVRCAGRMSGRSDRLARRVLRQHVAHR